MQVGIKSFDHKSVIPDLPAPSEYMDSLKDMYERRWYSNFGPLNAQFEEGIFTAFGFENETCVTASNATAGLTAALLSSGSTGPVIIPAFTFPATLGAVRAASMTPVIVDVSPHDWIPTPDILETAISTTGAKIVILVSPFGMRNNFKQQLEVCQRMGASVVIDSAAGLGVARPKRLGIANLYEVFSLHATKPMGVGEGAVIFAPKNKEGAIRSALNFGLMRADTTESASWGINGKLSEMHAAVGLAQLKRRHRLLSGRQAFVSIYIDRLGFSSQLEFPKNPNDSPWQIFPVLMPDEITLLRFIDDAASQGIEIRRYYRPSLSEWPGEHGFGPCSVSVDLAKRMCALPVRDHTAPDAEFIVSMIEAGIKRAIS